MAHDVFISYSSQDKAIADAVCATLEARKVRCWIAPRDILPGQDWGDAIIGAIARSHVFVLVFSSHADRSAQVRREVERAVHKEKVVIPFRIEGVVPSGSMEYFLSIPHWLDALTPPLEEHLETLTRTVRRLLSDREEGPARVEEAPLPDDPPAAQVVELPPPAPEPARIEEPPPPAEPSEPEKSATPGPAGPRIEPGAGSSPSPAGRPRRSRRLLLAISLGLLPTLGLGLWYGRRLVFDPPTPLATPWDHPTVKFNFDGDATGAQRYLDQGLRHGDSGDYDRAILDFTEAIRLDPNEPLAYQGRGLALARKGDFGRASEDLSTAIVLVPDPDPILYRARGECFFNTSYYNLAIVDFTKAIRLDPNRSATFMERGMAYRQAGETEKAEADFAKAAQLSK